MLSLIFGRKTFVFLARVQREYPFFMETSRGDTSRFYEFGRLRNEREYFDRLRQLIQDVEAQARAATAKKRAILCPTA
jgi:hypothetical protein